MKSLSVDSLWPNCGYKYLKVTEDGHLVVTDNYLEHLLRRPELSPVDTSCDAERALFAQLCRNPRRSIDQASFAQIKNKDIVENYRAWLHFRDRLLSKETLEASYMAFFQGDGVDFPPVLVDGIAQVIVLHILGPLATATQARVGEMFFRTQTITLEKDSVIAVDHLTLAERSPGRTYGTLGQLLGSGGIVPALGNLTVLNEDTEDQYWQTNENFEMAVMINWGQPAVKALSSLIERWVLHLLGVEVKVQAVGEIRDNKWAWHLGLDTQSSRILNDLYLGHELDSESMARLLALFKLEFVNPYDMLTKVMGKPVYMAIGMDKQNNLKIKPQNLILNLPLTLRS